MLERFDFLFSYWIFTWYIFYELKFVSYNPKGAIVLALVVNIIGLLMMWYYSYVYIFYFFILIIILKGIPLWRVFHDPYSMKDVYATIILFFIYIIWISIHRINIVPVIQNQLENIKKNKPMGPIMYLFFK